MSAGRAIGSRVLAVQATVVLAGALVLVPTAAVPQASSQPAQQGPDRSGKSTPRVDVPARGQQGTTSRVTKSPKARRHGGATVSSWESAFWADAMAQQALARRPAPYGLVATIRNDPTQPLDPKPFRSPYIRGIALQILWSDIEPAEGKPNWARLDELFAAAQASHKWVHLYIIPGFFAPAWALQGNVEQDLFKVDYGFYSRGSNQKVPLPMPYDPLYLGRWFAFVKLVSERYGNHPAFLMIGAAGPTSVSEEFTEPDLHPLEIAVWLKHHYTSTKYIEAWQETFQVYAKLFPNQYVSLSHGNGVQINALGAYDPSEPLRTRTEVVGEGLSTLGARFVFQSSALRGNDHHEEDIQMVISYNGRCATGFLLSTSCENAAAAMGAIGNPPLALTRTIMNGMQLSPSTGKHADYIEVHAIDVDAADLQPVLPWGASLFPP
jgi:hypothetical protein